jgi:uncharacterized protein YcbK (DUF882 family)
MKLRTLLGAWLFAAALALPAGGGGGEVEARPRKQSSVNKKSTPRAARSARKPTRRKGQRLCTGKGRKRRCRYVPYFSGHGVKAEQLRTEPVPRPSGEVWLYAENFREEIKLNIYGEDGAIDEEALAALDHGFRCKRTNEERAVDPRLYETLSTIYDHFGQKRIDLISGFRFQRNEGSRHFHAAAMDIRIEGVSIKELYEFAESLDTGGMGIGIYPVSNFVHVDWRAPGEPSYRWTDRTGKRNDPGKRPSKSWKPKAKKPTS